MLSIPKYALLKNTKNGGKQSAEISALIDRSITEVVMTEGITTIGIYALAYCRKATKIVLPESLITIESHALYYCNAITELTIPASVTTIGTNGMRNCHALTEVTFEGTPSSIDANAFTNDTKLVDIYVPWSEGAVANAPWGATNATIHYDVDVGE